MPNVAPTPEMLAQLPAPISIKPDGAPPWPRILVSGPGGSRKSWTMAKLSTDERLGGMFWLEVGADNVTAREYGAIPGANYTLIGHDGTWNGIMGQLGAHWLLAVEAEKRGDPPIALAVDDMAAVNDMLETMKDQRARRKMAAKLEAKNEDPAGAWRSDVDVDVTPDLHNLGKYRHRQFMWFVLSWPGPVLMACGEDMATIYENEKPTKKKDWTLKGRKDLPKTISGWFRLVPGEVPLQLKLRSVREGIVREEKGEDEQNRPIPRPGLSLATAIFDWVGCEAGVSRAPQIIDLDADQDAPGEVPPSRSAERNEATLTKAVQLILSAASLADTEHWLKITEGSPLRDREVTHLVTEPDREALGMREDQAITLLPLAQLVVGYCRRHGDGHQCDGNEHVSAHGPRSAPENPGTPITSGNGVKAAAS